MSFKTALTDVVLCGRALAMLPEEPITNMDQVGNVGRNCRLWYKPTVAWLLEKHHWNLAIHRTALAEVANTRSNQWAHAYALPNDAAFLIGLAPQSGDAGVGYYAAVRQLLQPSMFERVGQVMYTNVEAAFIDHTSYNVTESEFDEMFANVVATTLASRLAMPITKKVALADKLKAEASDMLTLAMTRNANENQPTYGNTPTETEIARGAFGSTGYYDSGWPAL